MTDDEVADLIKPPDVPMSWPQKKKLRALKSLRDGFLRFFGRNGIIMSPGQKKILEGMDKNILKCEKNA